MNLRQLEYFVALADEGSFTRAAETVLVSQPSLSQQIRALEAELGGALIERLHRTIRLTAAGKVFLPEARAVVSAAQRSRRAARLAFDLQAGELEIAAVRSVAAGLLPDSLERFGRAHPGVLLRLHELGHRAVLEQQVRDGLGDIAVGPRPRSWHGPVEPLGWEEFVLVLPPGDRPSSGDQRIPLDVFSDRRWVLFDPANGLSELVGAACRAAGFQPQVAVQTGSVEAAARMAAAGLGPALVPGNAVPYELLAAVRGVSAPVARELVAFTRGDFSPLALGFVAALRERAWPAKPRGAFVLS
jgi:DNA-binding transcriptional LysR family regulator